METPGAPKRANRKILADPKRQMKLTLAMLAIAILSTAALTGYLLFRFSSVVAMLQNSQPDVANLLNTTIAPVLDGMLLCQAVLWICSIFVGAVISNRIYGPLVPILRQIKRLTNGEYGARVKLRKGDELGEVAVALNELADSLEKKN